MCENTNARPTPKTVADEMIAAIELDTESGELKRHSDRTGVLRVDSFSGMHDIVDANEYILLAHPDWDGTDECVALTNAATDLVDAWLRANPLDFDY